MSASTTETFAPLGPAQWPASNADRPGTGPVSLGQARALTQSQYETTEHEAGTIEISWVQFPQKTELTNPSSPTFAANKSANCAGFGAPARGGAASTKKRRLILITGSDTVETN